MKKHERGGIHGLIADVIETNPGYEKAVEAVMGERLQYVIVESHKEGVAAIEYLKANSSGRGSFVPVKDVRGASPMPVQAGDFNYPGAKELISEVKIKEGYPSIVNYLLGDTLVVDTLGAALELWSQSGLFRTIVTLEGDLIDAQGIITGGSLSSSDGILQKRGEIRSIKKLSAGLEEKIASFEAGLKGIEEGIAGAKASLDECRESLHAIDIERVNIEGNLKRSAEESARLTRTRDSAESEVKDAAVKISEMISRKASLSAERDSLENQLQAREGTIVALANEISSLAGEKDALLGIVTEIRVKLAQAKERFESLKRQIAEKDRSILDADRRLEVRKAEIEKGRSESEEKSRLVEESKRKLDGFISAIDGVKKEEVAKTEQLNALATRIKEVEHELKEIKANYSELQELKGELSIEVKELELSAINLRERINEKYVINLAPFTHAEGETMPDVEFNEAKRNELREKIADLGEVSLSALEEYADLERRHQFLLDQQTDLTKSVETLHTAITRINRTTREKFKTAFEEISHKFQETFPKFFNGGRAELRLTEEGDILEAGVEIVAQPPGKRLQNITLLSGGEKALTATALIFAIFLIKPSPFCLLDEVDAPLDDANIDRFNTFVKEMSKISQFMLITHNKKTMEMADALYGITMEEPGVSKMISVKF
ncbi:MAG: chromosome segregation protein SMC [Deltaproteobacteria bacterium]|nr:chromosome segregation protein SMC [Deltaproteobacteria bacterium]